MHFLNSFYWLTRLVLRRFHGSFIYVYSTDSMKLAMIPVVYHFISTGRRTNAIAAICSSGLVSVELTTSTVDQHMFFDYVWGSLIPNMMSINGTNARSIAVMSEKVLDLFHQAGVLVLFPPPYNPYLNPMKWHSASYIKSYWRKYHECLQAVSNPQNIIRSAFCSIIASHCHSWIHHSGYNRVQNPNIFFFIIFQK